MLSIYICKFKINRIHIKVCETFDKALLRKIHMYISLNELLHWIVLVKYRVEGGNGIYPLSFLIRYMENDNVLIAHDNKVVYC